MILGVSTGIITARYLGPQIKGQAALLTMITQTLFMFGSMGLGSAFSFFIAKKTFPSRQIISASLVATIFFGTVSIGFFYISYPLHANIWLGIPHNLIFLSTLLSALTIYVNYLTRIVVGYGWIYAMNISDFVRAIINFLVTIILLVIFHIQLEGVIIAIWLATLGQSLFLISTLKKDIYPAKFWNGKLISSSLTYGIKSHALLIINFLNYRIDMILVKYFADDIAVGYYSLAVGMAELMWLIPNATVAPLFARVAKSNKEDRSNFTLLTVRWSLVFLLFLSTLGIVLGKTFISLLYGKEFVPSYLPFLGLLPGIILFPIFKILVIDLSARGYPGYGTIASLGALLVNLVINVILIPLMGILGAAIASSLSYGCMSFLSIIFFCSQTNTKWRDIFIIRKNEISFIMNNIHLTYNKKK